MNNSKQFLVIIRGAPASGKTTIAKKLRNFRNKIVWLKVDNFKDFFSGNPSLREQQYVDECALVTLCYLLDKGFSVVMEKIFYNPSVIPLAVNEAKKRGIKVAVFQIRCSLAVLQERDRTRPGVKEGCRKPLGDKTIKRLYDQLEKTFYSGAIVLNTEELSVEECLRKIKESVEIS
jgi:tRNA uridine 5-carbamoylmethylation protein Kti12